MIPLQNKILTALLFFTILGPLSAQDFLHNIKKGESQGFQTIEGTTDSGINVRIIEVSTSVNGQLIARIKDLISSFSVIPVDSVRITLKPAGEAELSFTFSQFQWNGYNMAEFLPSGFSVKLCDWTDYVTDLFIEKKSIHLEGSYKSESDFLDALTRIISDPGSFLLSRDPEYIFRNFMDLTNKYEDLCKENKTLKEKLADLKYNSLLAENRTLFGKIKKIDRVDVDWIVKRKSENRSLDAKSLKTELLSRRGTRLKLKTIRLIIGMYFGEF